MQIGAIEINGALVKKRNIYQGVNYPILAICLPFGDNETLDDQELEKRTHSCAVEGSWGSKAFFALLYISVFQLEDRLQYKVIADISPLPGLQAPAFPLPTSRVSWGQALASQSCVLRAVKEMDVGL